MSATPTDAEREQAETVAEHSRYRGERVLVKQIAQALADQRARYEAVADELDADDDPDQPHCDAAERIRQMTS